MTIEWSNFLFVVLVSLGAASIVVTTFSLGLRLADGTGAGRRAASVSLFVVCALVALFGVYLIVPALHGG